MQAVDVTVDDTIAVADAIAYCATAAGVCMFALSVNDTVHANNTGTTAAALILIPINTDIGSR